MACVFWRGALIDVWNSILSRLPSRARMPSAPRFDARSLAVDLLSRVREVELNELGGAGRGHEYAPLPALLESSQNVVLRLDVPGEIVFAGLQHCAGRRDGVTASLHLQRVEERAVGPVVA